MSTPIWALALECQKCHGSPVVCECDFCGDTFCDQCADMGACPSCGESGSENEGAPDEEPEDEA